MISERKADHLVVKVTTQHPQWPYLRQTPGGHGHWGRYRFVVDEPVERCDYWVVAEGLDRAESALCSPESTVLVTWEPPSGIRPRYHPRFVRQFGTVLTCRRDLRHPRTRYGQQGHPWFVGRSYDELRAASTLPPKSAPLVIITSDKAFSAGHRARLDFALALKEHFGDDARLVGRGLESFDDKWDVLAPARYAVAAENLVHEDWLTEKLPDCLLAGAFPLYHGAPNAHRYFPQGAFATVDVADVTGSVRTIERLMGDPQHYDDAVPHLLEARSHYLDRLQLFPMLASLLDSLPPPAARTARPLVLHPEPRSVARRVVDRLRR